MLFKPPVSQTRWTALSAISHVKHFCLSSRFLSFLTNSYILVPRNIFLYQGFLRDILSIRLGNARWCKMQHIDELWNQSSSIRWLSLDFSKVKQYKDDFFYLINYITVCLETLKRHLPLLKPSLPWSAPTIKCFVSIIELSQRLL